VAAGMFTLTPPPTFALTVPVTGLYLCSNAHAYVFESQRYVPEAVAYLNSVCLLLLPQAEVSPIPRVLPWLP
jgi:hypothetical protein